MAFNSSALLLSNHLYSAYLLFFFLLFFKKKNSVVKDIWEHVWLSTSVSKTDEHLTVWRWEPKLLGKKKSHTLKMEWLKTIAVKN